MKYPAKLSVFILACTGLGAACAQGSVTLYGLLDTGIEYVSHADAKGASAAWRMSPGNTSGSRWGLRGKEDLGGGLAGIFTLESGFASDSGASLQGGRLFGRQAWVGLEGRWGRLTLGRQTNVLFDLIPQFDPVRYMTYSLLSQDAQFTGRADNAVKYSGDFGAMTVVGMYSAGYDASIVNGGEVPGNYRVGQEMGLGARYTQNRFAVAVAYDQRHGTTAAAASAIERRYVAAAGYDFGKFGLSAGYRHLQNSIAIPNYRANLYWFGASTDLTPRLALRGGIYWNDQYRTPNDALSYVITAQYSLSKRTLGYVNASYMDNRGKSSVGVALGSSAAAGVGQTGVVAGIKHVF
ncbi:Outer membrane porin protein [compost metagenome]